MPNFLLYSIGSKVKNTIQEFGNLNISFSDRSTLNIMCRSKLNGVDISRGVCEGGNAEVLLDKNLLSVEWMEASVDLHFSDGNVVSIGLMLDDMTGPEAFTYSNPAKGSFIEHGPY